MSPKKSPKKQHPLPDRVDFKVWKSRVVPHLRSPTCEGQTLHRWMEKQAEYLIAIGDMDGAEEDSLLECVYNMTRPPLASEPDRKRNEFAAAKLENLLPQIESTIGALRAAGSQVVSEGGIPSVDVARLLPSLQEASIQIRGALIFLAQPYARSADALSYCLVFLNQLRGDNNSEIDKKHIDLVRVIMGAHGFSDDDLRAGNISRDSLKRRTIHKRIDAVLRQHFALVESHLEMSREQRNEPPFDPTFWKMQNVPEILRRVELLQQRDLAEFLQKWVARQKEVAEFLQKLAAEKIPPKSL